jgi:hypothetical protein
MTAWLVSLLFVLPYAWALPLCIRAIVRRRRQGISLIFPALLTLYVMTSFVSGVGRAIYSCAYALGTGTFAANKAALLAQGISETVNCTAMALLLLPLFGAGWLIDRKLRGPTRMPPP